MSGASARFGDWTENKILAITADAGFQVKNILVEGRHYTDADAIRAIVNVNKDDPLFLFKPAPAQEMIEKLSWVETAQVERRLPDTVYIGLEERVPLALWQRNKRLSLIDSQGVVLTDQNLNRFKDFIIVVGDDVSDKAPSFIRLLQAEPELFRRVESAKLISSRRWDIKLKNGVTVKLPEEDLPLALTRLSAMHAEEKLLDKDIKVIDVREPTRITVRTKPGAALEYKTGYEKTNHSGGAI